jgi:hypothetical protein
VALRLLENSNGVGKLPEEGGLQRRAENIEFREYDHTIV